MAKVLLINGSPKENGNTFTALSEVAKTLNSEGVATEIISIGKQAVQGCMACGMCGRNGAGSVVTKDIPSNSIAVGNPCKVIKKLESAL